MNSHPVHLYADRLPPLIGGMEMHGAAFIDHFSKSARFPLTSLVSDTGPVVPRQDVPEPHIVFFNSGRWIEQLRQLRRRHPSALFVYRTGGNEIIKAPLSHGQLPRHADRQAFWAGALSDTVDLLVTNSALTEKRLTGIGVRCTFARVVGGVDAARLMVSRPRRAAKVTLFCAARFVPYKNHTLLLDVFHQLVQAGEDLYLRLAGDGPLHQQVADRIAGLNLSKRVVLLGAVDNARVCEEIIDADAYIQLSGDVPTEVPGGSYLHCEGMGRSILEAITAGTPVIAGHSGALPEIVSPERGLLVPLDDAATIARRIRAWMPTRRRANPTSIFDWHHVFTAYERLWEERLARPHRH